MNRAILLLVPVLCIACVSKQDLPPPDGETEGSPCSPTELQCGDVCVNPASDRLNCGGCGNACDTTETCQAGVCTCLEGYEDCGGACVNVQIDRSHCGECYNSCDALATCQSGTCLCPTGLTECDGACVDINTDALNCGGCGNACTGGEFCNGRGTCALECDAPYTLCNPGTDAYCADLQDDPFNCSACGAACPERDHAAPVCLESTCTIVCDFGYGNANGDETDGCECTITSAAELCDAVDNDCNGSVDEAFACVLGASEACTLVASCTGQHQCVLPSCTWGACANPVWDCLNPGEDVKTQDCGDGNCGAQTCTCTDSCAWGPYSECTLKATSQCWPGDMDDQDCGDCRVRWRECDTDCTWGSWGDCEGDPC